MGVRMDVIYNTKIGLSQVKGVRANRVGSAEVGEPRARDGG